MRKASGVLSLLLLPLVAHATGPDSSEMQDRARGVIFNRAVPLMESATRGETLSPDEARAIALLLEEQRRTMLLFLNYSALTGQELQDKLQQVLDITRTQIEGTRASATPRP